MMQKTLIAAGLTGLLLAGNRDAGAGDVDRAAFQERHRQPKQHSDRCRLAPLLARPVGPDALPLVLARPLGPGAVPLGAQSRADRPGQLPGV